MGDLASLMQEPIIDEAHVEEDLCLLIGLLAAHNEPETSDQTARDLATHSQSEGREHPSPANPAAPNPAAQAMAAYLREHASTTVRLEEVAAAAGLDKYRALRSFTAAFGLMLSNRTKSTCKLHRSTPAMQPDKAFLCRKLR